MTKSTKVAAVNTSATRDHAALAGELSQLALQAGYLNQRSASLPNQGWLWTVRGTQEILRGPLQASKTHPSTPQSHEPANQGEFQKNRPLC